MLGNGLAQALQFGSILILSRIYEPSDFGFLAKVQSFAMIGAIWITLQLHLTIPLDQSVEKAKQAILAIEKISFAIFAILAIPVAFTIIPGFITEDAIGYAVVLSLFLGLSNTYNGYLVYHGHFGKISAFYIVRAIIVVGMQILFSMLIIENGLVIATLMGEAFAAIYLRAHRIGRLKMGFKTNIKLISYIKQNREFSLYGSIQETVSVGAFFTPLFLFTYKFGEEIGGQYAMANRLVWAPIVLLSSSFAQVYYHRIGRLDAIKSINIVGKNGLIFSMIGLLIVLSTFLMVDLFFIALGREWKLASELLPIQLVWGFFFLISTPFRVLGRAMRMQRLQLMIDALFILAIVSLSIIIDTNPHGMMALITMIAFIQHASICHFVNKKVND
jgi:O-antigen/teichoic acid export membrane protein